MFEGKNNHTNPKLSKYIWTQKARLLGYQRQNIIKQMKLSVLQVKAATLTATLLLLAVTNYSLQAVEKSFSSNSQSLD